ncbi:MAG: hypothetical protein K6B12_02910 [Clostridiales bacterium]|nr:hypothetical protein [Clostridiales bacterium]
MLRNNKVNAVIAFIASLLLWIYVVGQVDPATTGRLVDVPVVFAGEESLTENGLALVDTGEVTVDLTIKGDRSDVRKLLASSDKVSVVADVSGLTKGTHEVPLDIRIPNTVELQKASIDDVTVVIDDLVTKDIDVQVDFEGAFEVSQSAGNVTVTPETIAVTGAASTVKSIDHLAVTVNVAELTEKTTRLTKNAVPVDANGGQVSRVKLASSEVQVTAAIVGSKTVPFTAETTGTPADGYEQGQISAPSTVTVSGPPSVLEDLKEVAAEPVDITGMTQSSTVPLTPVLPEGVTVTEPQPLEATIEIKGASTVTKNWTYASSEIEVRDVPDGLAAEIVTASVEVTVSGEKDVLDNLKKSDLTLHVSAKDLEEGEHEVEVVQSSSLDADKVVIAPQKIKIILQAVTTEE